MEKGKAIERINATEDKKLVSALEEIQKDLTRYFEGLSCSQVKTILREYDYEAKAVMKSID